jgi:hypothetical protein
MTCTLMKLVNIPTNLKKVIFFLTASFLNFSGKYRKLKKTKEVKSETEEEDETADEEDSEPYTPPNTFYETLIPESPLILTSEMLPPLEPFPSDLKSIETLQSPLKEYNNNNQTRQSPLPFPSTLYGTPVGGVPIPSSPATDFASSQQQIYRDLFGGEAFCLPSDDLIFPHNLFCDDESDESSPSQDVRFDVVPGGYNTLKVRVPHKIEYSY